MDWELAQLLAYLRVKSTSDSSYRQYLEFSLIHQKSSKGSYINHVDNWGGGGLAKWPFCYIKGGGKNTQKFDHVVYGWPQGTYEDERNANSYNGSRANSVQHQDPYREPPRNAYARSNVRFFHNFLKCGSFYEYIESYSVPRIRSMMNFISWRAGLKTTYSKVPFNWKARGY